MSLEPDPAFSRGDAASGAVPVAEPPAVDGAEFSPAAMTEFRRSVAVYQAELRTESGRIARRNGADTVSAAYVRQAAERLVVHTRSRVLRLAGTLGGVALGAAIPNLLELATASGRPPMHTLASAALGVVGAFLVALQFMAD